MDLIRQGLAIASNPKNNKWLSPPLLVADAALCAIIIWKIPYTEIDWEAYMQQVEQYMAGERDYGKLYGSTGPLVYPAAHVYIYRVLHELTSGGTDILHAQFIFAGLYLVALAFVLACYRAARVPPYILPLLVASKRLHSIFILRLFNDGIAVLLLFAAIALYQRNMWTIGSIVFSIGLGVKMSLLLALPAVGVVLWLGMGRDRAFTQASLIFQVQLLLGLPFFSAAPRNYALRAFELTRQFMFKWTVNWRFVGEDIFLSKIFSIALLLVHVALLITFFVTRWIKPTGVSTSTAIGHIFHTPSEKVQLAIERRVTPEFMMTTICSAMAIGCLCARSLHYQFYAYIAWTTPFLLWRSGLHPILIYVVWAAQEWAWNVYPSTDASSIVVVDSLLAAVIGVWIGTQTQPRVEEGKQHPHTE